MERKNPCVHLLRARVKNNHPKSLWYETNRTSRPEETPRSRVQKPKESKVTKQESRKQKENRNPIAQKKKKETLSMFEDKTARNTYTMKKLGEPKHTKPSVRGSTLQPNLRR